MAILLESLIFYILIAFLSIVREVIAYYKNFIFTYWEQKGVPVITPRTPAGNIGRCLIGKESLGLRLEHLYRQFKARGYKHAGIYFLNSPLYMPLDPKIIKHILIKDFQNFIDRGVYYNETYDPLSAHLVAIEGLKWKNMRNRLSPTFTSGKMKMMFEVVNECGSKLDEFCAETVKNNQPLDIKDVLARYTTDIIGSCAFGIECNSLKDPNSKFRVMGKKVFDFSVFLAAKNFVGMGYPDIGKWFNMRIIDTQVSDFFIRVFKETMRYREENNISRKDFMQILIDMKNEDACKSKSSEEKTGPKLSMLELAAQAFVFFVGGFETSSTTLTYCLYELSKNQNIQNKLRDEIVSVLNEHDGKITYDGLMKMSYMDKIINETLRKYPPLPFLNRKCTSDSYTVPGTNVHLTKGSSVIISVLGLQRDPEYYPDPENFDPERFSEENKATRHPCCFLPFGEGPRNCIGFRFGIMQTKAGLTTLLKNYVLTLNHKTKKELDFSPLTIFLTPKDDVLLDIKRK